MEDASIVQWRKSSYSNGGENACIEVASSDGVLVRDTTDRAGGALNFSAAAWERFTASLR